MAMGSCSVYAKQPVERYMQQGAAQVQGLPCGLMTACVLLNLQAHSLHSRLRPADGRLGQSALSTHNAHRYVTSQEVVLPPPVRFVHQSFTLSTAVPLNLSSGGMIVMFSAKYQSFGLVLSLTLKPYSKSVKFFIMGKLLFTMDSILPLSW